MIIKLQCAACGAEALCYVYPPTKHDPKHPTWVSGGANYRILEPCACTKVDYEAAEKARREKTDVYLAERGIRIDE